MLGKSLRIGAVLLLGILAVGALALWALPGTAEAAPGSGGRGDQGWGQGVGQGSDAQGVSVPVLDPVAPGTLTADEIEAPTLALADEHKAWSTYEAIIDEFGAVRPFTSIQGAEENHIAALETLFARYSVDLPDVDAPVADVSFGSLADACEGGVEAEIENAALYDELLDMVDQPDIIRVFTALQQASLTKHLPAFERCAP